MATRDKYIPQSWANLPLRTTPVSAARLLYVENGIKDVADKRALKEIYDDTGTRIGDLNTIVSVPQYIVAGNGNTLQNGAQLIVIGNSNNVGGGFNAIFGCGHTVNGSGNITGGTENSAAESNATMFGRGLIAVADQNVSGRYNVKDTEHKYVHIIGGGNTYERKNIHTVDWSGNAWFAGNVSDGNGITLNSIKSMVDALKTTVEALEDGSTGDVPVATVSSAGIVKPDGKTITIDDDGTLHVVKSDGGKSNDTIIALEFEFVDQTDITEEAIPWMQEQ